MKHANISIFIPHNGCPNQCSFCDQKKITGSVKQPSVSEVDKILQDARNNLKYDSKDTEIAFFGGSFTAINRQYMINLLNIAEKHIKSGYFAGIRISTRPDCINPDVLNILKDKVVTSIELGAQSMDDDVLKANRRGHTSQDVVYSANLIKKFGFSLGLQMMTGLYESTPEKDYYTAECLAKLRPDTVRIYPTVVMKDTMLEKLYVENKYVPFSFDETVELCARLLELFENLSIPVIRLGLQDSESLRNSTVTGAWHPAFREICESRMLLKKCLDILKANVVKFGNINIYVNSKCLSKMVGQRKSNIDKLRELGYVACVKPDDSLNKFDVRIENCR